MEAKPDTDATTISAIIAAVLAAAGALKKWFDFRNEEGRRQSGVDAAVREAAESIIRGLREEVERMRTERLEDRAEVDRLRDLNAELREQVATLKLQVDTLTKRIAEGETARC